MVKEITPIEGFCGICGQEDCVVFVRDYDKFLCAFCFEMYRIFLKIDLLLKKIMPTKNDSKNI